MDVEETTALEALPNRFILREGKVPRHPYQATVGDHTDPKQHLSLREALNLAEGKYGIGFAPDVYHLILDFDHVFHGEKLDPDIAEVLKSLPPTYIEYSPSGTGLHSFYRVDATTYERIKETEGRLQFGPTVAIDLLTAGRYVTITANPYHNSVNRVAPLSLSNFERAMFVARGFTQRYRPDSSWNSAFSTAATPDQMAIWRDQLSNGDTHNEPTCGLIYNYIFHQGREDIEEIEVELNELMSHSPTAGDPAWRKNQRHTIPRVIRESVRIRNEVAVKRHDLVITNSLCTHRGSAEIVKNAFGDRLAYLPQFKLWYWHKDYHFEERYTEGVTPLVFTICDQYLKESISEANDKGDPKVAQAYAKWRMQMRDERNQSRVTSVLKGLMYSNISEFEPQPHYLNTESGIVDLRNGKLLQHDPKYKMLQICGCHYAPDMATPVWDKFLADVCCGDEELQSYLVAVLGYLITGEVAEHKFFSFYGDGGNGKSTLIGLLQYIMGKGGGAVGSQMITAKASSFNRNNNNNDNDYFAFLALCKTSRILVCQEAGGGKRLDDERIKAITGGDRIIARPLFGRNFEYDPMFKLLFTTNDRLNISGSDEGIWRRALEFHFRADFKGANRDFGMLGKLKAEAPGILGKLVRSAVRYYDNGGLPQQADAVKTATAEWRHDADPISRFVAEEVERTNSADDFIFSDELWHRFLAWKQEEGSNKRIEKQGFSEAIKKYQFTSTQKRVAGKKGRGYSGIRWVTELPEIPSDGPEF
jgi:P4 family phage/plasmid primase-like protien